MNLICTVVTVTRTIRWWDSALRSHHAASAPMKKTHNGRLFPLGWWHLIDAIKWHHADTVDMLLIGVLPGIPLAWGQCHDFQLSVAAQCQRYGFKWAQAMPQNGNEYPCAEQLAVFPIRISTNDSVVTKRPITL